jgi:hypothetical protein
MGIDVPLLVGRSSRGCTVHRGGGYARASASGATTSSWLNRPWLSALALTLPIQFVLLRFGAPGSTLDQLGVLLTIVQWLLIGRIFTPRGRRPAAG